MDGVPGKYERDWMMDDLAFLRMLTVARLSHSQVSLNVQSLLVDLSLINSLSTTSTGPIGITLTQLRSIPMAY